MMMMKPYWFLIFCFHPHSIFFVRDCFTRIENKVIILLSSVVMVLEAFFFSFKSLHVSSSSKNQTEKRVFLCHTSSHYITPPSFFFYSYLSHKYCYFTYTPHTSCEFFFIFLHKKNFFYPPFNIFFYSRLTCQWTYTYVCAARLILIR